MTRETKVGIAVAGSFLSLIGGVFGVKFIGPLDRPTASEVAQADTGTVDPPTATPREHESSPSAVEPPQPLAAPEPEPVKPAFAPAGRLPAGVIPTGAQADLPAVPEPKPATPVKNEPPPAPEVKFTLPDVNAKDEPKPAEAPKPPPEVKFALPDVKPSMAEEKPKEPPTPEVKFALPDVKPPMPEAKKDEPKPAAPLFALPEAKPAEPKKDEPKSPEPPAPEVKFALPDAKPPMPEPKDAPPPPDGNFAAPEAKPAEPKKDTPPPAPEVKFTLPAAEPKDVPPPPMPPKERKDTVPPPEPMGLKPVEVVKPPEPMGLKPVEVVKPPEPSNPFGDPPPAPKGETRPVGGAKAVPIPIDDPAPKPPAPLKAEPPMPPLPPMPVGSGAAGIAPPVGAAPVTEPTTGFGTPPPMAVAQAPGRPTSFDAASPQPPRNSPLRPTTTGRAESFDEDLYPVRPGETYREVSQQFYHTERYERALQLYNRDNPYGGNGPTADPFAPRPGQTVRVPPVRVLERDYAQALGNVAPLPQTGLAPATAPQPVPTVGAPPTAPRQPTQVVNGYPVYMVTDANGEFIREIARRTLGSGEYWDRIYQLNPRINPGARIPAGTQLFLPPGARVPN